MLAGQVEDARSHKRISSEVVIVRRRAPRHFLLEIMKQERICPERV